MVEAGPNPATHEVVRWGLIDRAPWVFDAYGLLANTQILSRALRVMESWLRLSAQISADDKWRPAG